MPHTGEASELLSRGGQHLRSRPCRSKSKVRDHATRHVLWTVRHECRDRLIEEAFRHSFRVILRSRQERRAGAGEDNASNVVSAIAREIANNLAAADRVADQRDPFQIEVGEQAC